jgi:uncharacterized membrane protein YccC
MKPWQRNRFALVAIIIAAVVTMNYPSLSIGQMVSLIALYGLVFFLFVRYFNSYRS